MIRAGGGPDYYGQKPVVEPRQRTIHVHYGEHVACFTGEDLCWTVTDTHGLRISGTEGRSSVSYALFAAGRWDYVKYGPQPSPT